MAVIPHTVSQVLGYTGLLIQVIPRAKKDQGRHTYYFLRAYNQNREKILLKAWEKEVL